MLKFMKTTSSAAIAAAALTGLSGQASADIQHLDDVIITFSLCVGNDCVNGENFGFDTMRLKENNLRVHFDDTSVSASFPRNDWRIVINDTSNGGGSYFAIEDSTAGRIPFRIEAGAPVNALYVEDDGDVGVGTATPVVNLHVVDGNTPTLRLEQNGSSGFTAQTWDLAGNESNFFIRDATHGSRLPFRIEPNTPGDTLYLDSTGRLGLGTNSPADVIHIRDNTGTFFGLTYENVSGTASTWRTLMDPNSDRFVITKSGTGGSEVIIEANGNVLIRGTLTTGGVTCGTGCDEVFAEGFALPTIAEHGELMRSAGYLPNVGPTLEGEPINVSEKLGRMLNELETAHIYIDQLNGRLEFLEDQLNAGTQD